MDTGRGGAEADEGNNMNEVIFTNSNTRGRIHIMSIATGAQHVLALDTAGNVYSWGNNELGQLGTSEREYIAKNNSHNNSEMLGED